MKLSRSLVAWTSVVIAVVALAGCSSTTRTTSPTGPLDTTPPTLPDGVSQVFDSSTDSAWLTWNASPSADVVAYEVYKYQPDPSPGSTLVKVAETPADTPTWQIPLSSSRQTFYLRVRARDGAGNTSAFTPTYTATVPAYNGGPDPYRKQIDP